MLRGALIATIVKLMEGGVPSIIPTASLLRRGALRLSRLELKASRTASMDVWVIPESTEGSEVNRL